MAVPETTIVKIEEPTLTKEERVLTSRELGAYQWTLSHPQPRLSPDKQMQLFALFLQGNDCVEIARLNKGISLGQIIQSRVENRWDEQREEHVQSLLRTTRERIQQITLESVDFIVSQLGAAHKLYGDMVKKFQQTGDPADLGGFSIHGWKTYREAVDLLKTVTGQDTKKVSGEVLHKHVSAEPDAPLPSVKRPMTGEEANKAIKGVLTAGGGMLARKR